MTNISNAPFATEFEVFALRLAAPRLTQIPASGLDAATLAKLTPAQVVALGAANLASLTSAASAGLSPTDVAALGAAIDALSASALQGLSAGAAAALTSSALAGFSTTQTDALSAAQLNALSAPALAALHVNALTTKQVEGLSTRTLAAFTTQQIASLSATQVGALTAAQVRGLSNTALGAFTSADAAALTTTAFAALSASQLDTLIGADAGAIRTRQLAALTPAVAKGLSTAALAALTSTQADALTAACLNALSASQLQALHLNALSSACVAGLSGSTVAAMTAQQFAAAIGDAVASLTTAAVSRLTAADIQALNGTQLGEFTAAQQAALSAPAAAALAAAEHSNGGDADILNTFASQIVGGAIGYDGLLAVLDAAATGGMTAGKYDALVQIADELNTRSGPSASAYAQQIFTDVVNGDSANATWTGGAANSVALGDLSANSSQTQVDELIGKWFLGTDLPQMSPSSGYRYMAVDDPLFGSSGAPQIADIEQGQVGDCYFMAALEETALQDPSLIENMIRANGNGTYGVDFQVNGQNDYVTVNDQLASNGSYLYAAAAPTGALWAALIEKAYVELNTQTAAVNYSGGHANSYNTISGGADNGLMAITGQSAQMLSVYAGLSPASASADFNAVVSAFQAGQDVMFSTDDNSSTAGNWVNDHMFAVTGVNAANDTLTLSNPWGPAAAWENKSPSFTASMAQLEAERGELWCATGKPATA